MTGNEKARARGCPICDRPVVERERPFCSRRCREIDLHRWLGEHYAIPAGDEPSFEGGEDIDPDMRIGTGQGDSDCL